MFKQIIIIMVVVLFLFNNIFAQDNGEQKRKTIIKKETKSTKDELVGLKGKMAPNFTNISMNDLEYTLEDLKGKVVVINFWGTWCEPCIQEIPELNKLVEKFENKNIIFLGLATDKKEVLEDFLKKNPFKYIIFPKSGKISAKYFPTNPKKPDSFNFVYPVHVLIDKNGKVAEHFWGFNENTIKKIKQGINSLLKRELPKTEKSPFNDFKKHIKEQNNYLAALHDLENKEEEYLSSPLKGLYLDYMSYLHGWVGNHDESYKYEDKFLSTLKHIQDRRKSERKDISKSPLGNFKMIDAVSAIDEVAKKHQVIMINEEHRTPRHRAFTLQILSTLYQRGFRYFAAETISSSDTKLNKRGYPIQTSGFYTADPLYGDMIRTALQLGYKIIPYEYEEECKRLPDKPFECQEKREKGQAQNLHERILKNNPNAKILVHVGRGHNAKTKTPYFSFMAKHFQEITKIIPFTIDQLRFSERYNSLDESALYRFLTKQKTLNTSSVFQATNGDFYGKNEAYDMYIFHPRTAYKNGRPTWLEMNNLRKPQKINLKNLKLNQHSNELVHKEPILIQAFYSNESANAIPIDQIILYPRKEPSFLMLPKGSFNIRTINKSGKVFGQYKQTVK